jgi:RIH domain/Inositol 1,4,5-trisphosphate/ryanodine receptor
MSNNFLRYGD